MFDMVGTDAARDEDEEKLKARALGRGTLGNPGKDLGCVWQ